MTTDVSLFFAIVGIQTILAIAILRWVHISAKRTERSEQQRRIDLPGVAAKINADYVANDPSVLQWFKRIPFYPHASGEGGAYGVMRGLIWDKTHSIFFDLHALVGTGDDAYMSTQTVAMFHFGEGWLPQFQLERRGNDRSADRFVVETKRPQIELVDHRDFSRTFRISGDDVPAIRRMFTTDLCAFVDAHADWVIESTGAWLAVCRKNFRPGIAAYPDFVGTAVTFLEAFATQPEPEAGRRP
jgi:hypothetical protein